MSTEFNSFFSYDLHLWSIPPHPPEFTFSNTFQVEAEQITNSLEGYYLLRFRSLLRFLVVNDINSPYDVYTSPSPAAAGSKCFRYWLETSVDESVRRKQFDSFVLLGWLSGRASPPWQISSDSIVERGLAWSARLLLGLSVDRRIPPSLNVPVSWLTNVQQLDRGSLNEPEEIVPSLFFIKQLYEPCSSIWRDLLASCLTSIS